MGSGGGGGSFYDEDGVHARYTAHRAGEPHLSPNHVMEDPAFLAEVGDPTGLRIWDLGCGDARFGRQMLAGGALSYHGTDGSRRMVETAKQSLAGTTGTVELARIEDITPAVGSFDLVTARLSFHYVADLATVLSAAADALAAQGRIIFSVMHPVITSYDNMPTAGRTTWTVDDYFSPGPRRRQWLGSDVTWYHRTVEQYVAAVLDAGLTLRSLRECEPAPARFDGHEQELARRRRVPLFLLLSASV